jgi:hypothetical protein
LVRCADLTVTLRFPAVRAPALRFPAVLASTRRFPAMLDDVWCE